MSFQTTQYLLPSGSAGNTASFRPPRYSSLEDPLSPDFDDISFQFSDSITHSNENATEQAESTTTGPPRYSSAFHRAQSSWNLGQQPSAISELAAGFGDLSVATRAQVFEYHIKSGNNSKSRPRATLTVFSSNAAGFSNLGPSTSSGRMKMPKFRSKDLVEGCLELSLSSPLNINSISLAVRFSLSSLIVLLVLGILVERHHHHRLSRRRMLHFPRPQHLQLDSREWRSMVSWDIKIRLQQERKKV
jgi:hypothetical protein